MLSCKLHLQSVLRIAYTQALPDELFRSCEGQIATKRRTAVIVTAHDDKIFNCFDHIYALRDGALEAPKSPRSVITRSRRRRLSL